MQRIIFLILALVSGWDAHLCPAARYTTVGRGISSDFDRHARASRHKKVFEDYDEDYGEDFVQKCTKKKRAASCKNPFEPAALAIHESAVDANCYAQVELDDGRGDAAVKAVKQEAVPRRTGAVVQGQQFGVAGAWKTSGIALQALKREKKSTVTEPLLSQMSDADSLACAIVKMRISCEARVIAMREKVYANAGNVNWASIFEQAARDAEEIAYRYKQAELAIEAGEDPAIAFARYLLNMSIAGDSDHRAAKQSVCEKKDEGTVLVVAITEDADSDDAESRCVVEGEGEEAGQVFWGTAFQDHLVAGGDDVISGLSDFDGEAPSIIDEFAGAGDGSLIGGHYCTGFEDGLFGNLPWSLDPDYQAGYKAATEL